MIFLALGDAKVPDARYFAFWWNIGLTLNFETHWLKLCTLILGSQGEISVRKIKVKTFFFIFLSRFSVVFHFNHTISLLPVDNYNIQLSFDI